jgi:hypothetical protein
VRELSGEREVERHAESVDVGAGVGAGAGHHLGSQIRQRTHQRSRLGHRCLTFDPRSSEIGEARATAVE